jgi:hypothetical protein
VDASLHKVSIHHCDQVGWLLLCAPVIVLLCLLCFWVSFASSLSSSRFD